MERLGI